MISIACPRIFSAPTQCVDEYLQKRTVAMDRDEFFCFYFVFGFKAT